MDQKTITQQRAERAALIAHAGGLKPALENGALPRIIDTTLSEALVLGLLLQDVRIFLGVLGHGSTEIGEVLRIYQQRRIAARLCSSQRD